MAYKQTPGRGNSPKTGNGLPSPLKQDNGIELTGKYTKGVKTLKKKREEGKTDTGLNIDTQSGFATAKPYEKSFVPATSKSQRAHIVGGDKKTVASASTYGGGAEKLRREFTSDSASTMNRRNRSAELYNATSGGTKPDNLSGRQIASLVNIGKAKRTR
tara:strand:- start:754 stop:1230 length:477 start_codon:yes stop_codon:yes gene_type:complete